MNYTKLNNIVGWVVFAIATFVFVTTMEPTASFWDCGEFIATANGLEVGHPPGAPFWMLLSRIVISLAPQGMEAMSVNLISALSSSFTVLFLFWTITHFAKKIAIRTGEMTKGKIIAILSSGIVGGLAFTFSDTFWFSAVEAEVYAMSTLFTAVVFWLTLKWEERADQPTHWRWIILIAYLMGLSIGVHLLNLLAIPAMTFIYYFKRTEKVTVKGLALALGASLVILGVVQVGIIKLLVSFAGTTEKFFVNSLGLGFNSGVAFYMVLVSFIIIGVIWLSHKKGWVYLNVATVSIMVAILGYSTFALILVRSSANTPMDENNPENIFTILSYLNREQYGDRALTFGPYFNTPIVEPNYNLPVEKREKQYLDGKDVWVKSYSAYNAKGKRKASFRWEHEAKEYLGKQKDNSGYYIVREYVESGEKKRSVPNYEKSLSTVFPRMHSSTARHIPAYKRWSGYGGGGDPREVKKYQNYEKSLRYQESIKDTANYVLSAGSNISDQRVISMWTDKYKRASKAILGLQKKMKPTFGQNFQYFTDYQVGWMWWRYLMWNFSGRQNDNQGYGDFTNGNWITGIDSIDSLKLGNRENLSEAMKDNKGFNKFYMFPFILGLIGLIFMITKAPKDVTVIGLLFLLTGIAIIIYLNQPPIEPRERDYTFVGSFYAFAIWIGMGVFGLFYASKHLTLARFVKIALFAGIGLVFLALRDMLSGQGYFVAFSALYCVVVSFVLLGIMFALQKSSGTVRGIAAGLLCIIAPVLMAKDGYDDHTRAKRKTGLDFAKNYLDSLEPNAIIFTNGDNDTFPLWYAQEVEAYRRDVRVVNLSLLNTDWYIDQMKRKAYNSDPVPFKMPEYQYRQGTRDAVVLDNNKNRNNQFIDVSKAMEICLNDELTMDAGSKPMHFLPTNKFKLPVDSAYVINNGTVRPQDSDKIVDVEWTIKKQFLYKASLLVLDMLANNNWERPVYFAVTTGGDAYLGLEEYFQLEGLAYRLVPVRHPKLPNDNPNIEGGIAGDIMYENMMNRFQWGNMDDPTGVYMDETNRRMVTNLRLQFNNLAGQLIDEKDGKKALKALDKCIAVMPEKNIPYDRVMLALVDSYLRLGCTDSTVINQLGLDVGLSAEEKEMARNNGEKLALRLFEVMEEELDYYMSLEDNFAQALQKEKEDIDLRAAYQIVQMLGTYHENSEAFEGLEDRFNNLQKLMAEKKQKMIEQAKRERELQRF